MTLFATFPPLRPLAIALMLGMTCAMLPGADAPPASQPGLALRALSGRHTRVVWIQDAGPTACVYVEKPTVVLMGMDSEDGRGERTIIPTPRGVLKPLITADGTRVVFTDNVEHRVYVVDFDGKNLHAVLDHAECADVWTDPDDGTEWIYANCDEQRGKDRVGVFKRFRLDTPAVSELIWDKTAIGHAQISGDGLAASGGSGQGNSQGIFMLPNDNYTSPSGGCWPSMSPDDSHRFWVFGGTHRTIGIFTPLVPGSAKFSHLGVNLATAPGIPGNVEVYHPRWSNDLRYFVMTGPYAAFNWEGEAKITNEVAAGVEVYLGRFAEDLHEVEQWVQVTHNRRGDYWPDAWIEPKPGAQPRSKRAAQLPAAVAKSAASADGLQFVFTDLSAPNQIPDGQRIRLCALALTGHARYGRHGVLETSGGAATASEAAKVIQACAASGAFSLSCTVMPAAVQAGDPAVIAAIADADRTDVALLQSGGRFVVRLTTSAGPAAIDIGEAVPERAQHLSVTFAAGHLACYLDGRRALVREEISGDLHGWGAKAIRFGDDGSAAHRWAGALCDIAIHSRALAAAEVAAQAAVAGERAAARSPAARVLVDAVMVAHTLAADPLAIAPYTRCLTLSTYDVQQVVAGKLAAKRIAVLQWSVMDGKRLPAYEALKVGGTYRLALEDFADHPEQVPERQTNTVDGTDDLPLFYDVAFPAPAPAAANITGADVSWIGGDRDVAMWTPGDASASWSKPGGPSAHDRAVLDAANGRRTVTLDRSTVIGGLAIRQPGSGGNVVIAKAPLRIGGAPAPALAITGAGAALRMVGAPLTVSDVLLGQLTLEGACDLVGDGGVHAINVDQEGAGYRSAPGMVFSGPGQGAVGQATLSVTAVRLTHLGKGFTSPPTVVFSHPGTVGGRTASGKAVLDGHGSLQEIQLSDGGIGYTDAPAITISGGGGSDAGGQALCGVSGGVILAPGTGYVTMPTIVLQGGGGTGAHAVAHAQTTVFAATDAAANWSLINHGRLTQDGALLLLDHASTQSDQRYRASFRNDGTWTITHGAVRFVSSTGMRTDAVDPCFNSGTLTLLDGSSLAFRELTNTGAMTIGAGAALGGATFAAQDVVLRNGAKGTISMTGGTPERPITLGSIVATANGQRRIYNGGPDAPAVLEIGSGSDATTLLLTGGGNAVENAAGSRIALRHGATLQLIANDNGAANNFTWRPAYLSNHGLLELGGSLAVSGNQWGPIMLDNYGTVVISGDGAGFDRRKDPSLGICTGAAFANHDHARILGEGTFTYRNSTDLDPPDPRAASLPLLLCGTIAPGSADGSSIHPAILTFIGVDMILGVKAWLPTAPGNGAGLPTNDFSGGATFTLHLTGVNGACDQIVLKRAAAPAGGGRLVFASGVGTTLDLLTAPGFTPKGAYTVITAAAISGQFDDLRYQGKDHVPYTVRYAPTAVEVVFP